MIKIAMAVAIVFFLIPAAPFLFEICSAFVFAVNNFNSSYI